MEELIGDEALVSFVELKKFIGEPDLLCFGFLARRDILKGYHCIRNIIFFIIDGSTPTLDRNNFVPLVDFHILSGGTFALQSPHNRQVSKGIFLRGSSLIDLINL